RELSGSLEPCPVNEKSEERSNYGAGRENAERAVLRHTISLDDAPKQRRWTCPRKRTAIRGAPPRPWGFTQSTEPRDSRRSNRSNSACARGLTDIFYQSGIGIVTESAVGMTPRRNATF